MRWIALLLLTLTGCRSLMPTAANPIERTTAPHAFVSAYNDGSHFGLDIAVGGHGSFGMPNGWYVAGLIDTSRMTPDWDYRLEAGPWGDVPLGSVASYWLADPYTDAVRTQVMTTQDADAIHLQISLQDAPQGSRYWLDVVPIDANGQRESVPDEWHFVGEVPGSTLSVPL